MRVRRALKVSGWLLLSVAALPVAQAILLAASYQFTVRWSLSFVYGVIAIVVISAGGTGAGAPVVLAEPSGDDDLTGILGAAAMGLGCIGLFITTMSAHDIVLAATGEVETCVAVSAQVREEWDPPSSTAWKEFRLDCPSGHGATLKGDLHREVGSTWRVAFNPRDPADVVEATGRWGPFHWLVLLVWPVVFTLLDLAMGVRWLVLRRRSRVRDTPPED
ncbi:hypothetical protein [Actinosynnema sp. NPDC020468]|uniref:hypothetical protein n=1 Tax=Actinosynnema sp. NPDC020468 TaxID=3154488 RepID=UPI00340434B0